MDSSDSSAPLSTATTASVAMALSAALLVLVSISPCPANEMPEACAADGFESELTFVTFEAADASDLVRVLDAVWEQTGGGGTVPNVAPVAFPSGVRRLGPRTRKRAFLRGVLPHVLRANHRIVQERALLNAALRRVEAGEGLEETELLFVQDAARTYRLGKQAEERMRSDPAGLLEDLLERADVVPASLALAQAALESGWGSSRFLLEGNNLFGQWVFSTRGGMAPRERPEGAQYSMARFRDLGEAVAAYVRNLNTLWAYDSFRAIRARSRRAGHPLDACELAQGVLLYSVRRELYVEEVRRIIRDNRLTRFDGVAMQPVETAWLAQVLAASRDVANLDP